MAIKSNENIKVPPVASSSQHRLGSGVRRNGDEGTGEDEDGEAENLHCEAQEAGGQVVTWVLHLSYIQTGNWHR